MVFEIGIYRVSQKYLSNSAHPDSSLGVLENAQKILLVQSIVYGENTEKQSITSQQCNGQCIQWTHQRQYLHTFPDDKVQNFHSLYRVMHVQMTERW